MPRSAKRLTTQAYIERMVKRIVKKFKPEKIILFGSQARGDATPDSDVDLLIVMDSELSKFEQRFAIRETLRDIPIPVDIIVTTPADYAWRKDVIGTIEWPATQEGKVMYART